LILLIATAMIGAGMAEARGKGSSKSFRTYNGGKAIDGDTFRHDGKRYRLQQYNAPERGQPGAAGATRQLERKLGSGRYEWRPVAKDKYGRTIVEEGAKSRVSVGL